MDYEQYDQWSENVRMEREEYVQEKLTAEEFQRKTDKPRELTSYEAGKIKLADGRVCGSSLLHGISDLIRDDIFREKW